MMSDTNPPKEKDKAEDLSWRLLTDQLPPPVTLAEPSLQVIIEGVTQQICDASNTSQVKESLPSSSVTSRTG